MVELGLGSTGPGRAVASTGYKRSQFALDSADLRTHGLDVGVLLAEPLVVVDHVVGIEGLGDHATGLRSQIERPETDTTDSRQANDNGDDPETGEEGIADGASINRALPVVVRSGHVCLQRIRTREP